MNTLQKKLVLGAILMLSAIPLVAGAGENTAINTRNLGGPRFGMTYVPGNTQLASELEYNDMGRTISQFGWHFEHQVVPKGGGPQFVIEFVPMLAGVEYGKVIPNFTLVMGMRAPGGLEFGMGPNLTFSKSIPTLAEDGEYSEDGGDVQARTSLLLAVGKSFNYGGVSVPINLAYATSPEGNRVSLIFGYAIGSAGPTP